MDQSTTGLIETNYAVAQGGLVELSDTPLAFDDFTFTSGGTFAFKKPAAVNLALFQGVGVGSTIEVPGSVVLGATFGNNLAITTDLGTYAFNSVVFATPVTNSVATLDPTTLLEAVTFRGADTFNPTVQANAGQVGFAQFLWSNAANWTEGVPINGDSILTTYKSLSEYQFGDDDLPALTLASLNLALVNYVEVEHSLTIGTLTVNGGIIYAQSTDPAKPAVLTIGATAGSLTGPQYGKIPGDPDGTEIRAIGADATVIDRTPTDPIGAYGAISGMEYIVSSGGEFEFLSTAPAATSKFIFFDPTGEGSGGEGTIAFGAPGAVVAAALQNVAPNDVLELPGTSVSSVVFGANSLTVTTDTGTVAFTNVTYGSAVTGYTAALDATTGLVAITFTGPDVFEQNAKAASGALAGDYLWSNAANWSTGVVPVDGDSVATSLSGVDDIASLSLASLDLSANADVAVTGSRLTVGTVAVTGTGILEAAAGLAAAPVTVTVGALAGTGATLQADELQGTLVDDAATDPGETYNVFDGGKIELLSAAPSGSSQGNYYKFSTYSGPLGTVAFGNAAATNTLALSGVSPGETLELPGTSVSAVTFGTTSLSITTDAGTYDFTNVTYGSPVAGYTAAPDPTTGLVAITFTAPDVFEQNVKAASGPLAGDYLWSNAANWSLGTPPVDGSAVTVADQAASGYDDLPALSLASLSLYGSDLYVTGGNLTLGTVTGGGHLAPGGTSFYGTLTADASDAGAPVTVTVGSIADTSIYGDTFLASGTGATFVDRSATDLGEGYRALRGGVVELGTTPNSTSNFTFNETVIDAGTAGPSTFALSAPGPVVAAALQNVAPGDGLELPGTSVSSVVFGGNSLTVTTDTGTVAFTKVTYGSPVAGYTAAPDPMTGLVAITFTGPDVFEQNVKATSGPLNGWGSPQHAMYLEGLLIPAELLINGVSITQEDAAAEIHYLHLELEVVRCGV